MKKILLSCIAAMGIAATANAQLALENFNSGVLPPNWVLINDGHTVSTSFANSTIQAALTANAWIPVALFSSTPSDYQMLTTSYFTPAATADRWLITPAFTVNDPNMVIQWQDYDLGSGENMEVLVSPTAGTTAADFTASIYSNPASPSFGTNQVPIGAYNGTSIRIAFRDHVNDGYAMVLDNVQTVVLPAYDLGVSYIAIQPYVTTGSSNTITGSLHNYGVATITSLNINYSINGGAPVTTTTSGTNIALGHDYTYSSSTPWVPTTPGNYTIKVWSDNFNGGNADGAHANDTATVNVLVVDPTILQPKRIMIEEFTQASCDPCANAHVNVDTVYSNNASRASLVRYHVNFPGRDCMDSVTLNAFVSDRINYYGVNGVPDAQVDGAYVYPGGGSGGLSSSVIGNAATVGSPVSVNVTTTNYNTSTHTYSFSADIKAFCDIPAGLKAYAVLVVDTLTYALNQSTESIPQTIFPQVAEAMLPNASGTTLTAFTTGTTQTITASWTKDHRWGSAYSQWKYDSTSTGRIIVFVENDDFGFVYQAAEKAVNTAPVSVTAVKTNFGSMDIYPNPASTEATVALTLVNAANVNIEIYNVSGQVVYTKPAENRSAGSSVMGIDLSGFASGNYFVKVTVGEDQIIKKLTINK